MDEINIVNEVVWLCMINRDVGVGVGVGVSKDSCATKCFLEGVFEVVVKTSSFLFWTTPDMASKRAFCYCPNTRFSPTSEDDKMTSIIKATSNTQTSISY